MNNLNREEIPLVKINDTLKNSTNRVYFENKLKRMNEILESTGLPEEYYRHQEQIRKRKQEPSVFWIKGILSDADVNTNTFLLVVKGTDNLSELKYTITTLSSEVLTQLIKDYKDDMINVQVKQKIENGKECEYELIEVSH